MIFFVFEWKLYKQVTSCILQEKEEADNRYKMEKQNQELDENLIFMKAVTKIDSNFKIENVFLKIKKDEQLYSFSCKVHQATDE